MMPRVACGGDATTDHSVLLLVLVSECDHGDGTCDDISNEYDYDPKAMTHEQALEYKYIMDV
jgi:hypothetical protein